MADIQYVMTGLWIWQASGPIYGQLLGLVGIIGWAMLAVNSLIRAMR